MSKERVILADEQSHMEWTESPDHEEFGALMTVGEDGDWMRGTELMTFESATRCAEAKNLRLEFCPVNHEGNFPIGSYVHIDDGNKAALAITNPHREAHHITTGWFYHHPKHGLMIEITPLLRPHRLSLKSFAREDQLAN